MADPPDEYRIGRHPRVAKQIRSIVARAGLDGRRPKVLLALQTAVERLMTDPWEFGEPERNVAADAAPSARDQRRAPGEVEEAIDLHAPIGSSRQSTNQLWIGFPLRAADPIVTCCETRRSVSTMKP